MKSPKVISFLRAVLAVLICLQPLAAESGLLHRFQPRSDTVPWTRVQQEAVTPKGVLFLDASMDRQFTAARMRDQAALLETLRAHVDERIDEWHREVGSDEERLDEENARQRLSMISRIGEGLASHYPSLLHSYVFEIAATLLGMPARDLNFLLAVSESNDLHHLHATVEGRKNRRQVSGLLREAIRHKKHWTVHPFKEKIERFYLPGFPIVVQDDGWLGVEGRAKLMDAARLLRESGWLALHPGSMKHTETIYADSGDELGSDIIPEGSTRGLGHHNVKVRRDLGPDHVAETLVHEDAHHENEQDPRFKAILAFEKANKIRTVTHPWIGSYFSPTGRPSKLLAELRCYGLDTDLTLHLWRWRGRSPVDELPLATESYAAERVAKKILVVVFTRQLAAEAIKVLRRHPRRLNEEGRAWLDEWEHKWKQLDTEIQPYWEQLLDDLLVSPDKDVRLLGFLYTEYSWGADPARRSAYEKRLSAALATEEDPYVLSLETVS